MYDELVKSLRGAERFAESRGYSGLAYVVQQAADAIEKLSKQREYWELEAAAQETDKNYLIDENRKLVDAWHNALDLRNRWISVEEQLPEHGWYLAYGPTIKMEVLHFHSVEEVWSSERYYNIEVTHWMPLPEPPKEDRT